MEKIEIVVDFWLENDFWLEKETDLVCKKSEMNVKKYITSKSELTMKIRPFQAEASSPGAVTASSQLGLHRKTSSGMDTY